MIKFPYVVLLILFASAPALAQGAIYQFDNFDTPNGVRIYTEPTSVRGSDTRSRRRTKAASTNKVAASSAAGSGSAPRERRRSLVESTALFSVPSLPASVGNDSLRGYTTGSSQVDGFLVESGKNNGIDPLLLYSIMHQESSFKLHAISPKGARGLMQLMPVTALRYGVTNIFAPKQNIEGGARYLRFLLDRFDGDLNLALAGYNAGEGAVEKYGGHIPPYAETQEYVRRISRRYTLLRDPATPLYAPRLTAAQLASMQRPALPLTVYERTVFSVRLPDGRLQLMSQ